MFWVILKKSWFWVKLFFSEKGACGQFVTLRHVSLLCWWFWGCLYANRTWDRTHFYVKISISDYNNVILVDCGSPLLNLLICFKVVIPVYVTATTYFYSPLTPQVINVFFCVFFWVNGNSLSHSLGIVKGSKRGTWPMRNSVLFFRFPNPDVIHVPAFAQHKINKM